MDRNAVTTRGKQRIFLNIFGLSKDDNQQTGRIFIIDQDWSSLTTSANGYHIFHYDSDIEFILIKTDWEVEFRRIMPIDTASLSACIRWESRSGEHYHIFKVDPLQELIIAGSPTVRFLHCPKEEATALGHKRPSWTTKKPPRHWEAEDVHQRRDIITGKSYPPEHLDEVARRFQAWRAMTANRLFVFMMVPKHLEEGEWTQLLENGFQFFDDVPWVL